MVAHTVASFDEEPAAAAPAPIPTSMVAHTVAASPPKDSAPLEEYKKDAFEAMNKNVAVQNVVPAPSEAPKAPEAADAPKAAESPQAPEDKKKTYKIVMIRHGESEWNKENRFCGWFDAGLSEKGKSP